MSLPSRRRQRSVRLTVASGLLLVAAILVTWAVLDNVTGLLVFAAIVALVCGAAATRITYAELVQSRREAAADRAEQAQAYRWLEERRSRDHAAHTAVLQEQVAQREQAMAQLESALVSAQHRAAEATRKRNAEARLAAAESRRADAADASNLQLRSQLDQAQDQAAEAIVRLAELEQEVEVLRAELAAWQAQPQQYRRRA